MRAFILSLVFIVGFVNISKSQTSFVKVNCNEFTYNNVPYKPLVCNYVMGFNYDFSTGTYFISPDQSASNDWGWPNTWDPNFPIGTWYFDLNDNKTVSRQKLLNDLIRIKNLGFTEIRIGACISNDNTQLIIPTGGYSTYYPLMDQFISDAKNAGLRVIVLFGGTIPWHVNNQFKAFIENFCSHYQNEPTIMAYDLYNEPYESIPVFDASDKYDFAKLISEWAYCVKRNAPNHLVTLSTYGLDVSSFDPELMPLDFASFHFYSRTDNLARTKDMMDVYYYWCGKAYTMPWIILETGYAAAISTNPIISNTKVGTELEQQQFLTHTLQKSVDCNCKAYAWWKYQDSHWGNPEEDNFGIVQHWGMPNPNEASKLAASTFSTYPAMIKGSCPTPTNYFSVLNGSVSVTNGTGTVYDVSSGTPVPLSNVLVVGRDYTNPTFVTFTDANGNYTVKNNGSTNYIVKIIATMPGYETVIFDGNINVWPSANMVINMKKLNRNGWTKEWANSGSNQIANSTNTNNWQLSSFDKFYKGDFNGDSREDLLCIKYSNSSVTNDRMVVLTYSAVTGNSTSGFNVSSSWEVLWDNNGNQNIGEGIYPYRNKMVVGDFNGDGRDDILGYGGSWITWFKFGTDNNFHWTDSNYGSINGVPTSNSMSWIAPFNSSIIAGDFDNSGRDQIMAVGPGPNPWITTFKMDNAYNWQWWQSNNGLTNNTNYPLSRLTPYVAQLIAGDFDGDGRDDVLGNALPSGAMQLFWFNPSNGTWWMPSYWKDATNATGIYAYRNNLVVGNFDMDANDEILGFNNSYCVKFDFAHRNTGGLYWDSPYQSSISDWNINPVANNYLFIKTDKNSPEQLFAVRGSNASMYSCYVNNWGCSTLRLASDDGEPSNAGINALALDDFSIYPNPNNGVFDIYFNKGINKGELKISIIDVQGRQVNNVGYNFDKENIISITSDNLRSGVYFVRILSENNLVTKKIIVL